MSKLILPIVALFAPALRRRQPLIRPVPTPDREPPKHRVSGAIAALRRPIVDGAGTLLERAGAGLSLTERILRRALAWALGIETRAASMAVASVIEAEHRTAAWTRTAWAAAHSITASFVDPACPPVAVAPDLAVAACRVGTGSSFVALAQAVRRATSSIDLHFADRLADPTHARAAARLFTVSAALMSAGLLAVALSAARDPALQLGNLATAAARTNKTPSPAGDAVAASGAQPQPAPQAPAPAPPAPPVPPAPAAAAPAPIAPAPPATRGALPIGKGMWIYMPDHAEGGNANAIVTKAKAIGLTHIWIRAGSTKDGFNATGFLNAILPVAHANGIRVYAWDFAECNTPGDDVTRAVAEIMYTTPDGHRVDGFSPDIETPSEGTTGSAGNLTAYANALRAAVGAGYPLIATVPNPTPAALAHGYPYAQVLGPFDGVAPMVYWMNRDPGTDVANAIGFLRQFGKPIFPIGQAYDGALDGGPPGIPSAEQLIHFMHVADGLGASGISFWSWQHADDQAWQGIAAAGEFRLISGGPDTGLPPGMIRAYQLELSQLGFPVTVDGNYGPATVAAVSAYQQAAHLPVTGRIDDATRAFLLTPIAAPLKPS